MDHSFISAVPAAADEIGPGGIPASPLFPLPGNGGGPRGTAQVEAS